MGFRKMSGCCLLFSWVVLFASTLFASSVHAAGETAATEKAVATGQAAESAAPALELTDPGAYVYYLEMGKEWFIANGPNVIVGLIILVIGRWLAMWVAAVVKKGLERGGVEQTLRAFLGKLIYYVLLIAVIFAAAGKVGIDTTSFLAIFGAAGLAVGLALKDSLSNFASGVMLILFHPFKVGDLVTVNGVTGTVYRIDIFSTVILTADNQRIIVPNGGITSSIITNVNAEETRRVDMVVGIGYDDDIRLAKRTLEEIVTTDPRVLADPAPAIGVTALADSSVNLIVRPWVKSPDYWAVHNDLIEKIKLTFDEKGISIPYPQQDVHMHQRGREVS
ncbi:MAG: mechanosensitive ion channel domain-containing protein [Thermodesulfobacteriota bacterium]